MNWRRHEQAGGGIKTKTKQMKKKERKKVGGEVEQKIDLLRRQWQDEYDDTTEGTRFLPLPLLPPTLRASLSGTFLQTLPDLVTPLKGHSLSPRSCPATRSAPSERTMEAT